jgi:uncharacterized protein YfaT (DUF1175 family)
MAHTRLSKKNVQDIAAAAFYDWWYDAKIILRSYKHSGKHPPPMFRGGNRMGYVRYAANDVLGEGRGGWLKPAQDEKLDRAAARYAKSTINMWDKTNNPNADIARELLAVWRKEGML